MNKDYSLYLKQEFEKLHLTAAKLVTFFSALIIFISLHPDYMLRPNLFKEFFIIRMTVVLISLVLYGCCFLNFFKNKGKLICFVSLVIDGLMQDVFMRYVGYGDHYYAVLLLMYMVTMLIPWDLKTTFLVCLIIYSGYFIPVLLFDSAIVDSKLFMNHNVFQQQAIMIALVVNYFQYKTRRTGIINRFKLAEANRNKDLFLANMSHELRTPLTLSLTPVGEMLQGDLGKFDLDEHKKLRVVYDNMLSLLREINDLLDLTRFQEGKMVLKVAEYNLIELVEKIINRVRPVCQKKDIALEFSYKNKEEKLYFDYNKMEKVFINLLSNAIKFSDVGGKISIEVVGKKDQVKVFVKDTGLGIPEENLDSIFERFVQVDGTSTRQYGGSGIGLSLVKDILELHDAGILVESKEGEGTVFILEILKGIGHINSDFLMQHSQHDSEIEDLRYSNLIDKSNFVADNNKNIEEIENVSNKEKKNARILIVEDNVQMALKISEILACEYNVFIAQDGAQGLTRAKEIIPDLIVSDVMMPNKDGIEMLVELRQDKKFKKIPVIILSAKAEIENRIKGLQCGADDYMQKPFNARELQLRVKTILMKSMYEEELEEALRELEKTHNELKATQSELLHKEKLASIGQLAAGVAHEINTPVFTIDNWISVILRDIAKLKKGDTSKIESYLKDSRNCLHKVKHIVQSLLLFSRKNKEGIEFIDIHEGIESTLEILSHRLAHNKICIKKDYGELKKVEADLQQFNQIFLNIFQNAIDSIKEAKYKSVINNGIIEISTKQEKDCVIISLKDNGMGMPKDVASHVFEPFFTTKKVGEGTGLGMNIVHHIIHNHRGSIKLNSNEGQGAEFIITLYNRLPSNGY